MKASASKRKCRLGDMVEYSVRGGGSVKTRALRSNGVSGIGAAAWRAGGVGETASKRRRNGAQRRVQHSSGIRHQR